MRRRASDARCDAAAARQRLSGKQRRQIEHLAKIFPLKEDEARFAELYNRQQDLAERLVQAITSRPAPFRAAAASTPLHQPTPIDATRTGFMSA